MSRIFEALQRSESERAGFTFPEPASLPAELLEHEEKATRSDIGEFPVLQILSAPASRLVSLTDKEGQGAEQFLSLIHISDYSLCPPVANRDSGRH